MNIEDKDEFLDVMEGVPVRFLWKAMNTYGTGCNWNGCSKKLLYEYLFLGNSFRSHLSKLPSLYELRDHAIREQEASKKSMKELKEFKEAQEQNRDEEAKLKISMTKTQKATILLWIDKGYKIDGVQVRLTNGKDEIMVNDIDMK